MRGWGNYFKLADMKKLLKETDEWARRRIRVVYWKEWKRIKTKYRMLKALGLEHWKAKELACFLQSALGRSKYLLEGKFKLSNNKYLDLFVRKN